MPTKRFFAGTMSSRDLPMEPRALVPAKGDVLLVNAKAETLLMTLHGKSTDDESRFVVVDGNLKRLARTALVIHCASKSPLSPSMFDLLYAEFLTYNQAEELSRSIDECSENLPCGDDDGATSRQLINILFDCRDQLKVPIQDRHPYDEDFERSKMLNSLARRGYINHPQGEMTTSLNENDELHQFAFELHEDVDEYFVIPEHARSTEADVHCRNPFYQMPFYESFALWDFRPSSHGTLRMFCSRILAQWIDLRPNVFLHGGDLVQYIRYEKSRLGLSPLFDIALIDGSSDYGRDVAIVSGLLKINGSLITRSWSDSLEDVFLPASIGIDLQLFSKLTRLDCLGFLGGVQDISNRIRETLPRFTEGSQQLDFTWMKVGGTDPDLVVDDSFRDFCKQCCNRGGTPAVGLLLYGLNESKRTREVLNSIGFSLDHLDEIINWISWWEDSLSMSSCQTSQPPGPLATSKRMLKFEPLLMSMIQPASSPEWCQTLSNLFLSRLETFQIQPWDFDGNDSFALMKDLIRSLFELAVNSGGKRLVLLERDGEDGDSEVSVVIVLDGLYQNLQTGYPLIRAHVFRFIPCAGREREKRIIAALEKDFKPRLLRVTNDIERSFLRFAGELDALDSNLLSPFVINLSADDHQHLTSDEMRPSHTQTIAATSLKSFLTLYIRPVFPSQRVLAGERRAIREMELVTGCDLSGEGNIAHSMDSVKTYGNKLFKENVLDKAEFAYMIGGLLVFSKRSSVENSETIQTLASQLFCNLAAVQLRQTNRVRDALRSSILAIRFNPKWAKPLFRRAICLELLGELDQARIDLMEAKRLEPNDALIVEALKRVEAKWKEASGPK